MSEYTVDKIIDKTHKCLGCLKRCGVYKITNIVNNKMYIGSSKNILQRWKNHIRELESNSHNNMFLQEDWNEYGKDNFLFEILEECLEEERYTREQEYFDSLHPYYRSGNGYNISEKSTQRNETRVRLFRSTPFGDYYKAKAKGCRPFIMDKDYCDSTSREELEEACYSLENYYNIRADVIEQCGEDDWEWD